MFGREIEWLGAVMLRVPQINVASPAVVSLEVHEGGVRLDGVKLLADIRVTMRTAAETKILAESLGLVAFYRGEIIDDEIFSLWQGLVPVEGETMPLGVEVAAYESAGVAS